MKTPRSQADTMETCPGCGGDGHVHVLISGAHHDEEDYYECIENVLQRQAEQGEEVSTAALVLIQRLRQHITDFADSVTAEANHLEVFGDRPMGGRSAKRLHEMVSEHADQGLPKTSLTEDPHFEFEQGTGPESFDCPEAAPAQRKVEEPTPENTTAQQRRVINTDGISLVGWDENNRAVVEGMVGIPRQFHRWALTRKGDPADVKGYVRSTFMGYGNE